ncbi:unnamed protein product, partial [Amoebophrya sp. A25]|eukprot:GSA25T00026531001.1
MVLLAKQPERYHVFLDVDIWEQQSRERGHLGGREEKSSCKRGPPRLAHQNPTWSTGE